MYLNQIRIIRIFIVLIFGIGLCFPQSLEDLKRLREAYEENKKAQDAKSIIKKGIEDEEKVGGRAEVRLLVKPAEIKEYYDQKLRTIRSDLKLLEDLLSYTDSVPTLKYFGYDFFNRRDSILLLENIAVTSEYVLGPGDEVIISLWGLSQFQDRKIVERDGTIFIDNVGLLYLGGKTLLEAESYVLSRFSKVYSTLIQTPPTSYFDLTLGKVKNINVIIE